jgi:ATP-dependent RNA helicase DeaD
VLDEADEMLRMGFIDDVEKVLKKLPEQRQVALFSATMPPQIRRIAQTYLRDPVEVTIAAKTTTSANIRQRYWWVSGMHKLDALTRILEVEPFDAMIIFARTKAGTEELASKLQARGLARPRSTATCSRPSASAPSPAEGRQAGHPGRHRRGRARPGRGTHQPRAELRHPVRHRKLRAPHRPYRPRRPQRRGDPVRHPAREGHAAPDRARHPPADRDAAAERGSGQRHRISKFSSASANARRRRPGLLRAAGALRDEHDVPAIDVAAALASLLQGDPFLLQPASRPAHAPRARCRRPVRGD